jgi:hypothetical protein
MAFRQRGGWEILYCPEKTFRGSLSGIDVWTTLYTGNFPDGLRLRGKVRKGDMVKDWVIRTINGRQYLVEERPVAGKKPEIWYNERRIPRKVRASYDRVMEEYRLQLSSGLVYNVWENGN